MKTEYIPRKGDKFEAFIRGPDIPHRCNPLDCTNIIHDGGKLFVQTSAFSFDRGVWWFKKLTWGGKK